MASRSPQVDELARVVAQLVRLLQHLQLTEEGRLAVDGDVAGLRALSARHWDTPTPAGPTARALEDERLRATAHAYGGLQHLPLVASASATALPGPCRCTGSGDGRPA